MANPKLPKTVRTVKAICAIIHAEFNIPCDRMKINNWQTRHSPPFPQADLNNAFNVAKCIEWVKQLQKRKGVKTVGGDEQIELLDRRADEARAQSKILDVEEKQFDFDQKRGRYVEREIANRTIINTIAEYHSEAKQSVQSFCDVELAKKIISDIEARCARIANESV